MLGLKVALQGNLEKEFEKRRRAAKAGVSLATFEAATQIRDELRSQVRKAGLGRGPTSRGRKNKLEKAWTMITYPPKLRQRHSFNPAVLVYSKAPLIHAAFDRGGTIRANRANWLVIPLLPAIKQGFGHQLSLSKGSQPKRHSDVDAAIRRFGKLRFVKLDATTALLVADNATKTGRLRKTKARKGDKGVALFMLKKQVRLRKVLDIKRVFDKADRLLAKELAEGLTFDLDDAA